MGITIPSSLIFRRAATPQASHFATQSKFPGLRAGQNRRSQAQRQKGVQPVQQGQVMRAILPESEAGIENNLLPGDSRRLGHCTSRLR